MKLVEEARQFWKLWSVRLAAVAGIVAGVLSANPGLLLGLITYFPAGMIRNLAAAAIGVLVFAVPTIVRLMQQPAKGKPDAE